MNFVTSLDYNSLDNVLSFLRVNEYSNINTELNKIAKDKASRIITKAVKQWVSKCNGFIINIDNGLPVCQIKYVCAYANLNMRNVHTANHLIENTLSVIFRNIINAINVNIIYTNMDMAETYENILELESIEKKLHSLRLQIIKDTEFLDKLNNITDEFVFNSMYIMSHKNKNYETENEGLSECFEILYISIYNIVKAELSNMSLGHLNEFCYEFITNFIQKDTLLESNCLIKTQLENIFFRHGFNSLIKNLSYESVNSLTIKLI